MYLLVCAQIFSVVHDVLRVDLVVKIAGVEKHVNRELVAIGFAEEAEESYQSRVSYQLFRYSTGLMGSNVGHSICAARSP